MGVATNPNHAGADREVATQELNRELQDKGFLVTSTEDIINWARTGSLALDDVRPRLLRGGDDAHLDAAL
jgi:hypothetical protein